MFKPIKAVAISLALVLAVGAGVFAFFNFFPAGASVVSESRDSQIINAISREEQVVLLSLSVQGVLEEEQATAIGGWTLPGSTRSQLMVYGFNAKLGIDGRDVSITPTGEDSFLVRIPQFAFIGTSNQTFRLVDQSCGGMLCWVTPNVDPVESVNAILNGTNPDTSHQHYIDANTETLQDQARNFYGGIIRSIDPEIHLEFVFDA